MRTFGKRCLLCIALLIVVAGCAETNGAKYETFPLFDEWSKRDFAQSVVIPMFKSAAKIKR